MKKFFFNFLVVLASSIYLLSSNINTAHAAGNYYPTAKESGMFNSIICAGNKQLLTITSCDDPCAAAMCAPNMSRDYYIAGSIEKDPVNGTVFSPGLLGTQATIVAQLFEYQPSGKEYVADILNNIGVPTVSRAYAQGTGYSAMSSFLPFWKVFRNLAYSLYIIMFVVVGIMIMLRTKVNAQTIITIQTALPIS